MRITWEGGGGAFFPFSCLGGLGRMGIPVDPASGPGVGASVPPLDVDARCLAGLAPVVRAGGALAFPSGLCRVWSARLGGGWQRWMEVDVGRRGWQGLGATRSDMVEFGSATACLMRAVILRRGGGGVGSIRSGRI